MSTGILAMAGSLRATDAQLLLLIRKYDGSVQPALINTVDWTSRPYRSAATHGLTTTHSRRPASPATMVLEDVIVSVTRAASRIAGTPPVWDEGIIAERPTILTALASAIQLQTTNYFDDRVSTP